MKLKIATIWLIVFASAALSSAKEKKDAPVQLLKVNDDRCTTLVANAFYTGRYLGLDNALTPVVLSQDLHCGDEFRRSDARYREGFVTIFGGSAISQSDSLYSGTMQFAHNWTALIHKYGNRFPILTGAGPGIMEAGNRGALAAGGPSIGYTTYYGKARSTKDPSLAYQTYKDTQIVTNGLILSSIEMREILMINHSAAAIVAPGGTGTEWELFEILDGLKNAQIKSMPVYLIGNKERNWASFQWLLNDMVKRGTVSDTVFKLFTYVENPLNVTDSLAARLLKTCPNCLTTPEGK